MKLHGWDVVTACSQTALNKLLNKRMTKLPPSLSYKDGGGHQIDLTFGPWQITSFGTDKRLTLEMPISKGTLQNTSKFSTKPTVKLDGVKIAVRITLDFVNNASGTASDLQFQFKSKAVSPNDKNPGAVFIASADMDGTLHAEDPSGNSTQILTDAMADCLVANGSKLGYALSSLNLAPDGDQKWLKPLIKNYMYAQGGKDAQGHPKPGYLVVATMVRDLPHDTRTEDIDPSLVDGSHEMSIAFAQELFLEHFVKPGLPSSFVGAKPSNFIMAGDMIMASIATGLLRCKSVHHWGTGYTPYLLLFEVKVDDDQLISNSTGTFDVTGLADSSVSFTIEQRMKCHFDKASQKLVFKENGKPTTNYDKHIPWWIYVTSAVVLPVLGVVVALIVAAIVDGIILGITAAVSKSVAGSGTTGAIGSWTKKVVSWPGSTSVDIDDVSLSSAFIVRGTIN